MIHDFDTSEDAWVFMRQCDKQGIPAGYPSMEANSEGLWTVETIEGHLPRDDKACHRIIHQILERLRLIDERLESLEKRTEK